MSYPASVIRVIEEVVQKYPSDIDTGVKVAVRSIRGLSVFGDFEKDLIQDAVRGMIHDVRSRMNHQARKEAGVYGQPAKVVSGLSQEVNAIAEKLYRGDSYYMAGKCLSDIRGEEFDDIIESESKTIGGHEFNIRLATALKKVVPNGKSVRNTLSDTRLRKIFDRAGGGPEGIAV